eukprot:GILJ01012593.1.p1 GENE.GILJ01012593.1~~GILJ01012593.1.p1  ORF type:complete len:194 (-),score=33.22 GILJ01012593.1:23-604(-)
MATKDASRRLFADLEEQVAKLTQELRAPDTPKSSTRLISPASAQKSPYPSSGRSINLSSPMVPTTNIVDSDVKHTEKLLRDEIDQRMKRMNAEQKALAELERELEELEKTTRQDATLLQKRIEANDREVARAQDLFDKKAKEFQEAKQRLDEKLEIRSVLTEELMNVMSEMDRAKKLKLEQLMSKLQQTIQRM